MVNGNTGGDEDDEVSHHRYFYWLRTDIPKYEGKDEQPFYTLWSLKTI